MSWPKRQLKLQLMPGRLKKPWLKLKAGSTKRRRESQPKASLLAKRSRRRGHKKRALLAKRRRQQLWPQVQNKRPKKPAKRQVLPVAWQCSHGLGSWYKWAQCPQWLDKSQWAQCPQWLDKSQWAQCPQWLDKSQKATCATWLPWSLAWQKQGGDKSWDSPHLGGQAKGKGGPPNPSYTSWLWWRHHRGGGGQGEQGEGGGKEGDPDKRSSPSAPEKAKHEVGNRLAWSASHWQQVLPCQQHVAARTVRQRVWLYLISFCGKKRAKEVHDWAWWEWGGWESVSTCPDPLGKRGKAMWRQEHDMSMLIDDRSDICAEALGLGIEVFPVMQADTNRRKKRNPLFPQVFADFEAVAKELLRRVQWSWQKIIKTLTKGFIHSPKSEDLAKRSSCMNQSAPHSTLTKGEPWQKEVAARIQIWYLDKRYLHVLYRFYWQPWQKVRLCFFKLNSICHKLLGVFCL